MNNQIRIVSLRTENKINPVCIDEAKPMLSWKFDDYPDGFEPTTYRIVAATAPDQLDAPDLWDSGKKDYMALPLVPYSGKWLAAGEQCFWRVMVWDREGGQTGWSQTATFRMGLRPEDWKSKWIGYDKEVIKAFDPGVRFYVADDFDKGTNELHLPPTPYLRKEFTIRKPMRRATVYISALGLYELRLNGEKVGDAYFTPGWSDFGKRVYYDAYELRLKPGGNTIGIILADGWYAGYVGLVSRHTWGEKPRVSAQLAIEYADGTRGEVCTDESWQAAYGEIREADLLHGETVDAQMAIPGWDQCGCVYAGWEKPDVSERPAALIQAHVGPYNRVIEEISPILLHTLPDGSLIFDTGKNITGFAQMSHIRAERGARVSFDYAEILSETGDIDKRSYRSARASDTYIAIGSGDESFAPHFTFRGFRYVKVSGLAAMPREGDLKGIFVSSDLRPIGQFECSSPVINRVYEMLCQTVHCGYLEVPMDCCERDERLGWGQDGNHSLRFGSYVYDISDFIRKWQNDILDSQKPDGSFGPTSPFVDMGDIGQFRGDIMADCGLQAPWVLYKMYGDTRILSHSYPAMKKYFSFMRGNSDRNMRNSITGDWLQVLGHGHTDTIHGWGDTARDLIGTAFYAYGAMILQKTAEALGLEQDAQEYREQFEKTRKAFRNTFEVRGNRFRDRTQTGYAMALYFNLLSEDMQAYVARYLNEDVVKHDNALTTGIAGIGYVLDALSENGYHETAVRALMREEYPSYGYMLRMGGTTCWERWDSMHHLSGNHPHNMNSYNHIGLTSAGAWFFKKPGGIDYIKPGFTEIKIEPYVEGGLTWVKASYESVFGKIGVEWEKRDGRTDFCITVPPGATAIVVLPDATRYESSEPLKLLGRHNGKLSFEAKCGRLSVALFHLL